MLVNVVFSSSKCDLTCMTNVSAAILSLSVPEDSTVLNHWTSDLPFSFSLTGGDTKVWGGGEDREKSDGEEERKDGEEGNTKDQAVATVWQIPCS